MSVDKEILRETALKLCSQVRAENKRKFISIARLQCWGCCRYAKGNPEKMCLSSNGGCNLINQRYRSQKEG